jgi:hypothetical protein
VHGSKHLAWAWDIRSFMAITGEGVYHHGMKKMIPGPVILRNLSFPSE